MIFFTRLVGRKTRRAADRDEDNEPEIRDDGNDDVRQEMPIIKYLWNLRCILFVVSKSGE